MCDCSGGGAVVRVRVARTRLGGFWRRAAQGKITMWFSAVLCHHLVLQLARTPEPLSFGTLSTKALPLPHSVCSSSAGEPNILVVNSPRARANFFDLGSFAEHMEAATERARPHLARARRGVTGSGAAAAAAAAAASAAAAAAAAAAVSGSAGGSSSGVVAPAPALVVNGVLAAGAAEQGTAAAARTTL